MCVCEFDLEKTGVSRDPLRTIVEGYMGRDKEVRVESIVCVCEYVGVCLYVHLKTSEDNVFTKVCLKRVVRERIRRGLVKQTKIGGNSPRWTATTTPQ